MSTSIPDAWLRPFHENYSKFHAPARRESAAGDTPWSVLDPFTRFVAVARRANPLFPPWLRGPVESLENLLVAQWEALLSARPPREEFNNKRVAFEDEKCSILRAIALRLSTLAILRPPFYSNSLEVNGLEFVDRITTAYPPHKLFPYARRDSRLEALECLNLIKLIFITATPSPAVEMPPEGVMAFTPYYERVPDELTSPSRTSAAELARAAMYFRRDRREKPIFRLRDIVATDFIPPAQKIEDCSLADFQYRAYTGKDVDMTGENDQLQANVSYFVAKIMKLLQILEIVRAPSCLLSNVAPRKATVLTAPSQSATSRPWSFDEALSPVQSGRPAPLSLISPLLMFLCTPFTVTDNPKPATLLNVSQSIPSSHILKMLKPACSCTALAALQNVLTESSIWGCTIFRPRSWMQSSRWQSGRSLQSAQL